MNQINKFVENLATFNVNSNVRNIYDFTDKNNGIRRNNLKLYLEMMKTKKPEFLLVGEAPGYRGCRLTGIPFTSEHILFKERFQVFADNGYKKTDECSEYRREPTATIIWSILNNFNFYPLLWNAYPFHPFESGNLESNREPTESERDVGSVFLMKLIKLFEVDTQKVVAIGKIAELSLKKYINPNCKYIRHPSRGGKSKFIRDLKLKLWGK